MDSDVHIVGAGLSGLSTALKLRTLGFSGEINIYEAANHIGGRCSSFVPPTFGGIKIDNPHMLLKANRNALKYLQNIKGEYRLFEFIPSLNLRGHKPAGIMKLAMKSIFNTDNNVPIHLLCTTLLKALRSPYPLFTTHDLDHTFNELFIVFAKNNNINIYLNSKCLDVIPNKQLVLQNRTIEISKKSFVVLALGPRQISHIIGDMGLETISYNPITNFHFLLDEQGTAFDFVGVPNGIADWYRIKGNLLSATISDSKVNFSENDIFSEAAKLFSLQKKYKKWILVVNKFATISQNRSNLRLRDDCLNKLAELPILFAGDWTVKNMPCTIEAAITSGFSAAKGIVMEQTSKTKF